MAGRSTIAGRVEALVRRMEGAPLCDECIADRLDLSSITQASVVTSAASGVGGFERTKGPCGLCGERRHVIRQDRMRVVSGKSVYVRRELGGRLVMKKTHVQSRTNRDTEHIH